MTVLLGLWQSSISDIHIIQYTLIKVNYAFALCALNVVDNFRGFMYDRALIIYGYCPTGLKAASDVCYRCCELVLSCLHLGGQ